MRLPLTIETGDLVYVDVFGQPMIFLNSEKAAIDLLEKRSANYSDRGSSVMLKDVYVRFF